MMELLNIFAVWKTDHPDTLCVEIEQKIAEEPEPTRDYYILVEGDEFGLSSTIREELAKINLPVGDWEDCPINVPYVEPAPDVISRRQFFQQLAVQEVITRQEALAAIASGAIPPAIEAVIDQIEDEDEKFNAQMLLIGAQSFERMHPLSDTVKDIAGWTAEERDAFWREAGKL